MIADPPIAIVDDDEIARETLVDLVRESGRMAIPIETPPASIDGLFRMVHDLGASQLICDHVLRQRWHVQYEGAEVVAAGFQRGMVSVLITQFIDTNLDRGIRRRKKHIPIVLARDAAMSDDSLVRALHEVQREITGDIPEIRKPYRTVFRIEAIEGFGNQRLIEVAIPAWRSSRAVELDEQIFPNELRDHLLIDKLFAANVNLSAEDHRELFFSDIALAAEPPADGSLG